MTLHELLDLHYCADGDETLRRMLAEGGDPDLRHGTRVETPLHVATRRRRATAVDILLAHGADIDARTAGGKTAYAHAVRRGFDEVATLLVRHAGPAVLHLRDPRLRIVRMHPSLFEVFFFGRVRSSFARSSRVGVSIPDALATCSSHSS